MKKFTLTALVLWTILGTACSVCAQDDHGNTYETATPIRVNSTVQGTIQVGPPQRNRYSHSNDSDYFRVEISRFGRLTFYLSGVAQGLKHPPTPFLNRAVL